jgi:hypothetical protein
MDTMYEKLFETYGVSILKGLDSFPYTAIQKLLDSLPLSQERKVEVMDDCTRYYYQWSADAFVIGLHLGLSLLHDDVRRAGPQQVQ